MLGASAVLSMSVWFLFNLTNLYKSAMLWLTLQQADIRRDSRGHRLMHMRDYGVRFSCLVPRGVGGSKPKGGTPSFKDGDDRMGAKIKTPKNPFGFQQNPKKSLDQKLNPQKRLNVCVCLYSSYQLILSFPHLVVILLGTPNSSVSTITLWMTTLNKTTRARISLIVLYSQNYAARIRGHYHESSDCFEYPNKSLLKSSRPKKYLPNCPTLKNPGIENFGPKEILRSSPSLEIQSTLFVVKTFVLL